MDLTPCWLKSQLVNNNDGTFAVKNPDGTYVSWRPDGSIGSHPDIVDQERITFVSQQNGYALYLANRESYGPQNPNPVLRDYKMLCFMVIIVG